VRLTPAAFQALAADHTTKKNRPSATANRVVSTLKAELTRWNAVDFQPVFPDGFAFPDLAARFELERFHTVAAAPGTDVVAMTTALQGLPDSVEEAYEEEIGTVAGEIPNDPEFFRLYALNNLGTAPTGGPHPGCPFTTTWCADADINAPEAWVVSTGESNVKVAVVDSGVTPHSEFASRMLLGRNTVTNTTDTTDGCPHGTHVAGIIAAAGDNGVGVAGVAWGVYVLPVRVLTGCSGGITDVAEGIVWAADNGADVINISLQFYGLGPTSHALMEGAVNYAYSAGAVVVAASGNGASGGQGVVAYPAVLDNCVAVGATTPCDEIASFESTGWISNWGPEVDLCAPGDDILSTWPGETYRCIFGTSMATGYVSGLAALLRSFRPELTNGDVIDLLVNGADDLGAPGWDPYYGHGRINAFRTMSSAAELPLGACCRIMSDCRILTRPACSSIRGEWHFERTCNEVERMCPGPDKEAR